MCRSVGFEGRFSFFSVSHCQPANPSPLLLDRNELQGLLWVGTLNCRALRALALVALGHACALVALPRNSVEALCRIGGANHTVCPKALATPKLNWPDEVLRKEQRHLKWCSRLAPQLPSSFCTSQAAPTQWSWTSPTSTLILDKTPNHAGPRAGGAWR